MIKISLISNNIKSLNKYIEKILIILKNNPCIFSGPINMPLKLKFFNILRSPHIDKNSRDQFEIRYYKKILFLKKYNKYLIKKIMNLNISPLLRVYLIKLKNKC